MQPQDLPEGLQEYLASERGNLLSENRILKAKNAELLIGHEILTAEVEAGLNALTGSNPMQNILPLASFVSSLPPPVTPMVPPHTPSFNLDVFPDEILSEILHHLHQPFHFYHYSNALLGISNPPPGSRPWNPVHLQLVCRQWKYLAQPLFYRQVAFDARDETTLALAARLTEEEESFDHPIFHSQDSIWIDLHPPGDSSGSSSSSSPDDGEDLDTLLIRVSFRVESKARFVALASSGASSTFAGRTFSERMFVLGNSPLEQAGEIVRTVGRGWDDSGEWNKGGARLGVHPNHLLMLRIPSYGVITSLTSILENTGDVPYLPRLQLDLPFPLTRSLLDSIFPILTSILQHPTLPTGRDFIFRHTGNLKKILFGTKSDKDASALRTRIDGLGVLEVVAEIVVLEL